MRRGITESVLHTNNADQPIRHKYKESKHAKIKDTN
jgi:hypothetical protein